MLLNLSSSFSKTRCGRRKRWWFALGCPEMVKEEKGFYLEICSVREKRLVICTGSDSSVTRQAFLVGGSVLASTVAWGSDRPVLAVGGTSVFLSRSENWQWGEEKPLTFLIWGRTLLSKYTGILWTLHPIVFNFFLVS